MFNSVNSSKSAGYLTVMAVLFLSLGLIISTQTKKFIQAEKSGISQTRKLDELVLILKEAQNKKKNLEKQLAELREQAGGINSTDNKLLSSQLQKMYQVAGLTPIKGEGLVIKLDEGQSSQDSFTNNSIQSDDLLKIMNELKAAGSTAIAINNQRIVTTSEVVTAGNNIVVNQSRVFPPYIIKATGPKNTMYSALKMRGGIIEYLEVFGIKISITSDNNVAVPPYTGSIM